MVFKNQSETAKAWPRVKRGPVTKKKRSTTSWTQPNILPSLLLLTKLRSSSYTLKKRKKLNKNNQVLTLSISVLCIEAECSDGTMCSNPKVKPDIKLKPNDVTFHSCFYFYGLFCSCVMSHVCPETCRNTEWLLVRMVTQSPTYKWV